LSPRARVALAVVALVAASCADDAGGSGAVSPAPYGAPYAKLASWHLFRDARTQAPNDRVEPFAITSPLFSDYTAKHRFFWIPEGTTITYRDEGVWGFPVGAIIVKTFSYPVDARDPSLGERLLETRLLVHEASGWVAHTYVWDAAQTEAVRQSAGDFIQVSWIDDAGATRQHRYVVPNTNECQECHGLKPDTDVLGPRTAQIEGLPGERLIDRWHAAGYFAEAPTAAAERPRYAAPDDQGASVSDRARAYLEANCAHCHSPRGDVASKTLFLDFAHTDPATQESSNWGVCKLPTSAGGATCGHTYDVVPGDADHSVMVCRMESTQGSDQMPPLGRGLVHAEGVALIRAWIDAMEPDDCR